MQVKDAIIRLKEKKQFFLRDSRDVVANNNLKHSSKKRNKLTSLATPRDLEDHGRQLTRRIMKFFPW